VLCDVLAFGLAAFSGSVEMTQTNTGFQFADGLGVFAVLFLKS